MNTDNFTGLFSWPNDKRSYQVIVVLSFTLATVIYFAVTSAWPFIHNQYDSWKNTRTALCKTELGLTEKQREIEEINKELTRQMQIIREKKITDSQPRQPSTENKYELAAQTKLSGEKSYEVGYHEAVAANKVVSTIARQTRYNLSGNGFEEEAKGCSRVTALTADHSHYNPSSLKRTSTKKGKTSSVRPEELYNRLPLPQPPSLESLRPRDPELEQRREIIRQQDEAYAIAMAEDARKMTEAAEGKYNEGPAGQQMDDDVEVPEEPAEGSAGSVTLVFRFLHPPTDAQSEQPSAASASAKLWRGHSKAVRRFCRSNSIKQVLAFVRSQDVVPCPTAYEVVRAYPKLSLSSPEFRDSTIEDLAIENNSSLTVRPL